MMSSLTSSQSRKAASSVPRGHDATTVPCSDIVIHGPVAYRLRRRFDFRPQAADGHFGWQTEFTATATAAIIPSRCNRKYLHRTNGRPASIIIHDAQRVQTADSK